MLAFVKENHVDMVIVDKVDRLARDRMDDAEINLALQLAGAQLVSVSEAIDDTPSGTLLHGIMSTIAEWYSSNLSVEVKTKTLEKVRKGGTPFKAPVGYLNVREVVNGRESRTVVVDETRAPLVRLRRQGRMARRRVRRHPHATHHPRPLRPGAVRAGSP